MVGSKGSVPQVIFANEYGSIINKWIEKSKKAKQIISNYNERELTDDELASLKSEKEVVNVIEELIDIAEKSIYYV